MIGIGATALCLRWGIYLAVLLDESKPLDPGAGSAAQSMISDHEMKRINLEFPANLGRLLRMLHEDERGCYRLLHLSYRHLPMPQLRGRQCAKLLDLLLGLTSPEFWNTAGADLRSRMDRACAIVVQHPYRILANSMAVAACRNGPVENLHAGRASGYALNRRPAKDRQSRELMQFTSRSQNGKFVRWVGPGRGCRQSLSTPKSQGLAVVWPGGGLFRPLRGPL